MGVIPQIEMWGGNGTIGRVSTAIFIAIEADHPKACFLEMPTTLTRAALGSMASNCSVVTL